MNCTKCRQSIPGQYISTIAISPPLYRFDCPYCQRVSVVNYKPSPEDYKRMPMDGWLYNKEGEVTGSVGGTFTWTVGPAHQVLATLLR